jgi:hypothetical protein
VDDAAGILADVAVRALLVKPDADAQLTDLKRG